MAGQVITDELRTVMALTGMARFEASMRRAEGLMHSYGRAAEAAAAQARGVAQQRTGGGGAAGGGPAGPLAAMAGFATRLNPLAIIIAVITLGMVGFGRATMGAVRELRTLAGQATNEFADWQKIMEEVRLQAGTDPTATLAIGSATLSDDMRGLGVSAKAAAEGYQILASMGYDAEQMQQAMVPITRTAIALGTEQAETTKLMIAIMTQYGLALSDMPQIADLMTSGLAATSMQGEDLIMVMKYAGVAASSLGWSFSETIAAVDPLVKALGNGEMAGTTFRGVLDRLKAPAEETAEAFKAAGLDVADFSKHSGSAAETLRWLQSGQWDAMKISRAFGAEVANGAQLWLRTSIPAMEAVEEKTRKVGSAQQFAEEKAKSLRGMYSQLTANTSDLLIMTGSLLAEWGGPYITAIGNIIRAVTNYMEGLWKAHEQQKLMNGTVKEAGVTWQGVAGTIISVAEMIAVAAIDLSRIMAFLAAKFIFAAYGASLATQYYTKFLAIIAKLKYTFRDTQENLFNLQVANAAVKGSEEYSKWLLNVHAALLLWSQGKGVEGAKDGVRKFADAIRDELATFSEMGLGGTEGLWAKGGGGAGGGSGYDIERQGEEDGEKYADGVKKGFTTDELMRTIADINERRFRKMLEWAEAASRITKNLTRDVNAATQAVIGGRLGEGIQEQLSRLGGDQFGGEWLRKNPRLISATANPQRREITVKLDAQNGQVIDVIADALFGKMVPVIQEAARRTPALGS